MKPRTRNGVVAAAVLAACAGLAISAFAQGDAASAPQVPSAPQPSPAPQPATAPGGPIRFNFKDAPFDQVLDFFSRESGLPIIREAQPPAGALTFISGEAYTFADAMSILNLNLLPHGVQLRREDKFLFLASIQDAVRKAGGVVVGAIPAGVTPDQILTMTIPLNNSQAATVAEQIKPLVGSYGTVTPVAPQNMLILVETAAQCRRIASIVQSIDNQRPQDSAYKLFPLRHAQAPAVFEALKGLIAEKRSTVIIDKDGKQRTVTEDSIQGLNIQPDPRTNSIIVVGPEARIKTVEELIALLDVPEGAAGDAQMMTFALSAVTPQEAAARLGELFKAVPDKQKPTIVPLPDVGKLTIVASVQHLTQARGLLGEIDPASGQAGRAAAPERRAAVVRFSHITTALVDQVAPRLLTPRQAQAIRWTALPDGKGVIAAGPSDDVAAFEQLVSGLDAPPDPGAVRLSVLTATAMPAGQLKDRALALYAQQVAQTPGAATPTVTADADSNTLVVVADPEAMTRFTQIVSELQKQGGTQREVRMLELKAAKAETVAAFLTDLVKSSESFRARSGPDPVIEAIEATNSLLVAAQNPQFAVIEQLVRSLDTRQGSERMPLRILRLRATDAANVASVLQQSFDRRSLEQKIKQPVDIQADAATNTLVVSAHPDLFPEIERIVEELNETQSMDAEGREIRIFPLKVARAEDLARTIDQMYPESPVPIDPRTRQPRPDLQRPREVIVRADRGTNALIVDAPAKRLAGFEQIVRSLDQQKPAGNVELRAYAVERADLGSVAATLRNLAASGAIYGGGPAPNIVTPVTIDTEPVTRTLIVSGPSEVFKGVEGVLKRLDSAPQRPRTALKMFALQHARADRLQPMLQKVLTTRLREQQLQDGGVVTDVQSLLDVAAEPTTNTLLISAPEGLMPVVEELIKSLDTEAAQVGRAVIRIVPLTFAEAPQVAQALNQTLPTVELPSGGRVTVLPAGGANALMLSGAEADLKKVEELIVALDAKPADADAQDVATYTLKHADAATMAPMVQRLLTDQLAADPRVLLEQIRARRGQLPTRPPVRVEADARNNWLVVSGPASSVKLAQSIIDRLDQPGERADRTAMVFTPNRGDPAQLAQTVARIVNETLPQGRKPVELTPEPRSGCIVVLGTPEQAAEAVKRLAEFDDRAASPPVVDLALIDLKHADARVLAGMAQMILADRTRWPDALRQAERAGLGIPQPAVNADPKANRVIVSAPTLLMPVVRQVIDAMDQPSVRGTTEVRVFKLTKGDATSAATALRAALTANPEPGEPPVTVAPDAASNTLVVAGTSIRLEQAAQVVAALDQGIKPDGVGVRTIYLKFAKADAVAPVLEGVLRKESVISLLPSWQVGQYLAQTGGKTGDEVRVAAERRLNAVVVSAPRPILEMAEQVVTELDVDPTTRATRPDRPIRIITLTNADAGELAANLLAVFADQPGGEEPPTVRVDKASNSLIVRAGDAQMATIGELATKLDSATLTTSRQLRTIPLDRSRTDAALMAQTLKRLLEQQGGVKVEVISIDDLLKRTDEPAGTKPRGDAGGGRWDSAWVALAIAAVAQPGADRKPQPAAEESGVTIAVDPATNSLIVVGSPRITDRLAALAAAIEKQMPAEPTRVRIVTLPEGADAGPINQVLQETIRQVGRAGPSNAGGFTGPVSAAPDPSGGALIVWANDTDFRTVAEVITAVSRLDRASSLTVKVYPLATVTAARAVQAVQDLLAPAPRGVQARRVRESYEMTLVGPDGTRAQARIDPAQVRLTADPGGTSVIVAAPAEAFPLLDLFIAAMDQSPVADRLAIRRYELKNAKAADLSGTMQQLFEAQRQGPAQNDLPRARFVADDRTNSMLVTASESQHADVRRLLDTMDAELGDPGMKLEILTLKNAQPSTVQQIVEQVVIGRDPAKKEKVRVSAQNDSNLFVVRAPAEQLDEIKRIVAQVDAADVPGLPMRTLKLQYADAQAVAAALGRFFQQRADAAARPGRRAAPRAAIIGDRRSGTLVVTASDDDFAQVQSLIATFDQPVASKEMQLRVIQLQNARVAELRETLENISSQLQWERSGGSPFYYFYGFGGRQQRDDDAPAEDKLYVDSNERTNSVILLGQGATLERMEAIVKALDVPVSQLADTVVRAVPIGAADPAAIARVIREATRTPGLPWYQNRDPDAVAIEPDPRRRMVVLVGKRPKVEAAVSYIEELARATGRPGQRIETVTLRHAQAERAGASLRRFFSERAQAEGLPDDQVSVIGSRDGNVLIVSADEASMKVARDLIAQIDQPEMGTDRRREVYVLRNAKADDLAGVLRSQFPAGGRSDAQVIVTPQPSTNSLIVSAPGEEFAQVDALVQQLDSAKLGDMSIVTVRLKTARSSEVVDALKAALPANVGVKITPLQRNNAVLLTGSAEAIALAEEQIGKIDAEPERTLTEFQRIRLKNVIASEVSFTLQAMLRSRPRSATDPAPSVDYSPADNTLFVSGTAEQLRDIVKMVESLDVPSDTQRATEFVKLQFANAEQTAKALEVFYGRWAPEATTPGARRVTIVPDPSSNSLVISADAQEWEGIRSLLKKLDTSEYDSSRQLTVISLKHADAVSVARALNEGFRAPIEDRARREQLQRQQNRQGQPQRPDDFNFPPPVLVDAEGTPSVSAEVQTNSLVVFAGRRDLERIQALVKQIDVPDFNRFPPAHVIPMQSGKASALAQSLRDLYQTQQGRAGGSRAVLIVGDDSTNALIVRAEEQDYAQIKAMADTLQQEGDKARASVRVLALKSVPAVRLQKTINATFTPAAKQWGEVLAVEVDRTSNALVIASSQRLYDEIEKVVRELDAILPAGADGVVRAPGVLGQSVFIIDVQNNSPAQVREQLEQLGLTKPPPDDRQGVVSEPITIVPLLSRRALAVVAGASDGESVVALVRALDAEPANAEQQVAVVPLKLATAAALVDTLKAMFNPADQASQTSPAKAIAEQVRRLNLTRTGIDQSELKLDLSRPIRLIADAQTNSVIVSSVKENLPALAEVIRTLDTLPIGDAVLVRIFPLVNASAARAKAVIEELFTQGEALRRLPGTTRRGLPSTATGRALAGEVAISVDDRTNTLIVAGREEAVAFIEVMLKDLDSDASAKWVEPLMIPLKHADAATLAGMLKQVLVQGLTVTPEAIGLQRQVGRLRMAKAGRDMSDPEGRIQADLFAPLTGLVITAEEQLNALIVVGSPANGEVVRELVSMLDVEAAAAANSVRIFPLQYAAADRVAGIVAGVFQQRSSLPGSRPEDRVAVASDPRTNALVISTSPKSFSIIEAMVRTLDTEKSNPTVGIHVVPVVGADAAALAPRVQTLMRERISAAQVQGGLRVPTDAFSIEADKGNNLLIVACSDENLEIVKELVGALAASNAALTGSMRTDVVQLRKGRAGEALTALRELYVDRENARRGAGSVTVVPNDRLNALVVTGTDTDLAAVRGLVERFENTEIAAVQNIRFIELKSANSLEVVNLLQNVLSGRSVGGPAGLGTRQATNLRFFREQVAGELQGRTGQKPTEAQVDSAVRELVTLTPDLRTNRVVVSAPPEMMRLLEDMIGELDSSKRDRRVEIIGLKNADARAMAELLRDVFNLRQQGSLYVLVPSQGEQSGTPPAGQDQPPATGGLGDMRFTPVPDERQQLSIALDARTNTLIVSGTDSYLDQVGKLVRQLDDVEATERARIVYHLKNAKAKDIEASLAKSFQSEADLQRGLLSGDLSGSVMRQLEQEVTVVGDEKSNKLIITVSPRYTEKVLELVKELDAAPPQVLIQVLLAEVTLDNSDNWGVDFKVKNFGGDSYNFGSLAAGAGVAAALGVPNLSFASTDFELLVRALESQGKLQVLSRPSVMINNNEKGFIQVGEDIAIVKSVDRAGDTGRTTANVERRDVGIILNVTPSISSDGFVRMELKPEISTLSQKTTQISEDFLAPIINKRQVDTVVTVKDGQTVVIGGLIQTTKDERRTKVPIIGDFPLIGSIFRSTQTSDVKTELLVILTPKVIYNDQPGGPERLHDLSEERINALESAETVRDTLRSDGMIPKNSPQPPPH
jgi:type II secretion system protein D